jgi:hypothetical protein
MYVFCDVSPKTASAPILNFEKTDNPDPSRIKPRIDKEEPREAQSKTEIDAPTRDLPKSESLEPKRITDRSEIDEPRCA